MNPNRWILNETTRWTSLLRKLRAEGKTNEQFEVMLGNLTLEEVIAAKLEVSAKTLRSPLFGLPIWKHLEEIVQDAVLKFAVSTTQTTSECARFLGIPQTKLVTIITKYKIWNYFDERAFKVFKKGDRIKTVDLTQENVDERKDN